MSKGFLAGLLALAILTVDCAPSLAFIGQLQTKRERRESKTVIASPAEDYEKIQESFLREDYESAFEQSGRYLSSRNYFRADEVLYIEALSLLKLNRTSEARDKLKTLEESSRSQELRAQAAVSTGDSYYLANDTFLAIQSYENTLKKYPRAAEVPYVQSRLTELSSKLGRPAPNFAQDGIAKLSTASSMLAGNPSLHQMAVEENAFYTVQVGSFSRERNAQMLMRKLSDRRYEAYIDNYLHDRMFRVRVGKVATHEEAAELEARLKKDGYPTKIFP